MQKLPVGISGFAELRETNCVYVDKTKHVYSLLENNRRTFLSRPRRFGKSLLVSTLVAALQGKKDLFKGLWISDSKYSWEPKGIIKLDFSKLSIENKDAFVRSLIYLLKDIAKVNEVLLGDNPDLNVIFMDLISVLYAKFKFVAILIDEYDLYLL